METRFYGFVAVIFHIVRVKHNHNHYLFIYINYILAFIITHKRAAELMCNFTFKRSGGAEHLIVELHFSWSERART